MEILVRIVSRGGLPLLVACFYAGTEGPLSKWAVINFGIALWFAGAKLDK